LNTTPPPSVRHCSQHHKTRKWKWKLLSATQANTWKLGKIMDHFIQLRRKKNTNKKAHALGPEV